MHLLSRCFPLTNQFVTNDGLAAPGRVLTMSTPNQVTIWSVSERVRRHGGRGHRLRLAGERFLVWPTEDAAAFPSLPYGLGEICCRS